MKKLPGVMLYLENLEPIKQLSKEEQGDLFIAILEYGKDGTLPQFSDTLAIVWAFILPRLQRDIEKYHLQSSRKRYGTYCREAARRGEIPISVEAWGLMNDEQQRQMISGNIIRYPSTSPSAAPTLSTPIPAATSKTDHRNGQVALSAYQMDSLRAKMGEDALNGYVGKLQRLLRDDPSFDKSHYLTILGWWSQGRQD